MALGFLRLSTAASGLPSTLSLRFLFSPPLYSLFPLMLLRLSDCLKLLNMLCVYPHKMSWNNFIFHLQTKFCVNPLEIVSARPVQCLSKLFLHPAVPTSLTLLFHSQAAPLVTHLPANALAGQPRLAQLWGLNTHKGDAKEALGS